MALVDRVRAVPQVNADDYTPFIIAGRRLGLIKPGFEPVLARFPEVFDVSAAAVTLAARLETPEARTAAVEDCLQTLRAEGLVPGWRGEHYPVCMRFHEPPAFTIERAAAPLFGTRHYGVHVNGFVRAPGGLLMWIGKRAKTKQTGPGKLDQLTAGGQPAVLGFYENAVKECAEEAGVDETLARRARAVGAVAYLTERAEGVRNDTAVVFDLELPAGFTPVNQDGEVEAFYLKPLDEVRAILADTDDFEFDSALVALDFLVRHGMLGADDPDFEEIIRGLRRPVLMD
ncbi:MAG: DUF4743 domain-containing protein [Rhodospirillales bacterium]